MKLNVILLKNLKLNPKLNLIEIFYKCLKFDLKNNQIIRTQLDKAWINLKINK